MTIFIPEPELQVTFSSALAEIRATMLQDALRETVRKLDIPTIDKELAELVPGHSLAILASHALRGEFFFPVPSVINANPRLLGYYRLLYGYSQKEFYAAAVAGRFKALEDRGVVSKAVSGDIAELCQAIAEAGTLLLAAISSAPINLGLLDDLTLLTLGPQLRGGANVKRGTAAIVAVFGVIKEIVQHAVTSSNARRIELRNAAGRAVFIEFASDPDIVIREEMPSGGLRHIVAMEVKGGQDFSNVHNRIGEAEKSHQKARDNKYTECWTVVNVDRIDLTMAKKESPSTDRFYRISSLIDATGAEYDDFKDRIIALTSIPSA
jgi:hypothetical protein